MISEEIKAKAIIEVPEYPKLMRSPKGAVVMYLEFNRGVVIHTNDESAWALGDDVNSEYAEDMLKYKGAIKLQN